MRLLFFYSTSPRPQAHRGRSGAGDAARGLKCSGAERPGHGRRPRQRRAPTTGRGHHAPHKTQGAPHNGRAAAAPPPHQIRPPPRDASRPTPARAARRRAPPLAAGTPENPIARAGGREAKGRRHPRQPAHRRGEPPAPPFFDCDNIKPPAAQHLVCAPYGTCHI